MTARTKSGHYRAKTLAASAGISTNLLRAWERRYELFEPDRQPSGHRLYTEDDLTVIRRVRDLLDSGLSIGEAAALGRAVLLQSRRAPVQSAPVAFELPVLSREQAELIGSLAPPDLKVHRSVRFAGEELGVSLRQLHPADLSLVYRLYQILKGTYEIWTYMEQRVVGQILLGRLRRLFEDGLMSEVQALGAATAHSDWLVNAALEDARTGALRVIYDYWQSLDLQQISGEDLQVLLTLARDHAKMLRNAFYDLDETLREADETLKAHSLRPVLRKLVACRGLQAGTDYQGPISSRCLETSALDRIVYNLLARSLGPQNKNAGLWVTQVNQDLCRWAFECSVERFRMPEAGELPVQAVAMAMGVTPEDALSFAYIGSARRGGRLWAWFHWPVYKPSPEVPHCLCEPLDNLPLS